MEILAVNYQLKHTALLSLLNSNERLSVPSDCFILLRLNLTKNYHQHSLKRAHKQDLPQWQGSLSVFVLAGKHFPTHLKKCKEFVFLKKSVQSEILTHSKLHISLVFLCSWLWSAYDIWTSFLHVSRAEVQLSTWQPAQDTAVRQGLEPPVSEFKVPLCHSLTVSTLPWISEFCMCREKSMKRPLGSALSLMSVLFGTWHVSCG